MHPVEQINDTTYGFKVPSGDIVEVGNRRSDKFEPHVKLNRWGNECFIVPSIEITSAVSNPRVSDEQVEIESDLSIVRFYPVAPTPQFELGSFRMEITHKKKPPTNKIVSTILSHNVRAFYQPPLTQQEIEEGSIRPDNIEGSYAFMHATRQPMHASKAIAEKYRACIFGHKPRPRIVDDDGNWCWAELYIDLATGLQIITIPLEFWEYAKYPIRHDAGADTFGYTTKGGTAKAIGAYVYGSLYAIGEDGTAQSITWYLLNTGEGGAKAAIYDSDKVKLSQGEDTIGTAYDDWFLISLDSNPSLTNSASYWLTGRVENACSCYYNSIAASYMYKTLAYADFPEDPLAGTFTSTRDFSVYCTYTPGEAPTEQAVGQGAITPVGALGLTTKITIGSGAITPSGALSTIWRALQSVGEGTITPAGALGRKIAIAIGAGSVTPGGVLSLLTKISIGAGSITPAGILGFLTKIAVGAGSITPTGALSKWFLQLVGQGTITPTGVLGRIIKIAIGAGSITPSGILGRLTKISIGAGIITPAGALVAKFVKSVGEGTVSIAGTLGRSIKIAVGDGVITPFSGILSRKIKIAVGAGSITPTGALSTIKRVIQWVGQGTITPIGALGLLTKITVSDIFETLRPDATGAEENIPLATGAGAGHHHEEVDDVVPDGAVTMVYIQAAGYLRDLYNIPNQSVGFGAINYIKLYFRAYSNYNGNSVKGVIRSNTTVTETAEKNPYSDFGSITWGTYSQQWNTNPANGQPWEGADIDALQIGVSIQSAAFKSTRCTQVYVEIHYVGAVTPIGTLGRKIAIAVGAGAITPTGALSAVLSKIYQTVGQGVITPVGTLGRNIYIAIGSGAVTPIGTLGRKIAVTIGQGTITPAGALVGKFVIVVGQGTVAIIGSLSRLIKISVGGGVITPISTLSIPQLVRKLVAWLLHRAYRDVTIQVRAYRDVSLDIRPYRDVELKMRG